MKYSDLIKDSEAKQDAETKAKAQVVTDQATLSESELAALDATQASDMADATLTAAVKLRPAGVLDPNTGQLYRVVDDKLIITTPVTADDEVPGSEGQRSSRR